MASYDHDDEGPFIFGRVWAGGWPLFFLKDPEKKQKYDDVKMKPRPPVPFKLRGHPFHFSLSHTQGNSMGLSCHYDDHRTRFSH